jgi:hypothetical protein
VGRGSVFLGPGTFVGGKGSMLWAKELDSCEEGDYFFGRDSIFFGRDSILVGRGSILLGLGTFFGGKGSMLWANELDSFEEGVDFLEGT